MIEGHCLCGGVRYEYDGELTELSLCHCSQCRRAQGSAFVTVSPVQAAQFRLLAGAGLASDLTILENNCTQSIATSAGYVVMPLTSSLAAYMLVTGIIPPWWQLVIWIFVVALIGVLGRIAAAWPPAAASP